MVQEERTRGNIQAMFGIQRLQKIREILLDKGFVDVQDLSEKLQVSDVTVRRDLDKLEKEGLIIKTYGGAILNNDINKSTAINKSKSKPAGTNTEQDKLISRIAIDMIAGDEAIFLFGGQICRLIANMLDNNKRLIVFTNDVFIASELYGNPNIKVTVTGGNMESDSGILVGPYVLRMLKEIYVNKAFIEVKGVHLKFGYSMENYEEVEIVKSIMEIANESIALADSSRFGTTSVTRLGDIDLFKKVISNKEVPEDYKKYCYDNCIKLYTTYELE